MVSGASESRVGIAASGLDVPTAGDRLATIFRIPADCHAYLRRRGDCGLLFRACFAKAVMKVFRLHLRLGLALAVGLNMTSAALAQREQSQPAPAVALDTDPVAAKMLGAARDYLVARQWADAVDLLRQIADQHGERLVAIEPGRYVNVQTFVDILIASMPPEGLHRYRAKIDPQARRWYESAKDVRDEAGLEKVVRKAFLSSYGDDALFLLGELAWEHGALARARSFWEQLLPPAAPASAGEPPLVLKYPDSPIDPAQIKARLVLCDVMQRNPDRAQIELKSFRSAYPQASGKLAGRQGNLAAVLEALLVEVDDTFAKSVSPGTSTFAGNPQRNQVQPQRFDVGGILWSAALKEMRVERPVRIDENFFDRFERGQAGLPIHVLSYFPVAWNHIAFFCDDTAVYACDLASEGVGKSPWGSGTVIYRLPPEFDLHQPPSRSRAGLPRYTLSIDRGRLYARLGALTAPAGRNRGLRPAASALVCLDLGRQGDLAWIIKAEDFEADGDKWTFDGAPLAAEGRVYVALRRNDPQLQLNVACFDASSAKLIWNRKVCGGVESIAGDVDDVRHQLLTLSEERLYYCTNIGAIASLDARDGAMRWVATYPRIESETISEFNKRQQRGPNPCVFHDGQIFAAPTDGDRILAFDAQTGVLKWNRELNGRAHHLLGVAGTRLISAGDQLWALDTNTGKVLWREGRTDPEAATWGHGLLAGDLIYWPRREEIRLVEIATGEVCRQINLSEQYGLNGGGNLMIAGGMLLLAQSDRLVAFSQFGTLRNPVDDTLAWLWRKRH